MDTHYGELSIERTENGILITQSQHDMVRLTDDEIDESVELLTAAVRANAGGSVIRAGQIGVSDG